MSHSHRHTHTHSHRTAGTFHPKLAIQLKPTYIDHVRTGNESLVSNQAAGQPHAHMQPAGSLIDVVVHLLAIAQ